ncbi:SPOR domain-containing protein [Nitrosomonas communis]|uniref:DedD protein n=1 Tax=Nitrosomonas communis TaxID=44574 RepID=A0A1I4N571_9PROT|nr:SPOR domain-containing protein [Nitrosomonas communis]SFM10734.1 DedD protein [Nitrosomonas communis]
MVKNISEEEALLRKRARRRLVGAVTLVILSVVFLPMILDSEPKQEQQEVDILIPSEDVASESFPWMTPGEPIEHDSNASTKSGELLPFSVPEFPLSDDESTEVYSASRIPIPSSKPRLNKPATQTNKSSIQAARPEYPKTQAAKPESIQAAKPEPVQTAKLEPMQTAKSESPKVEGKFVIQLGAFADPTKAKQQQQKLAASGVDAYIETIKVGGNEMVRVRVGPFPTRKAAEEGYEKLKKMGLSGVVTSR